LLEHESRFKSRTLRLDHNEGSSRTRPYHSALIPGTSLGVYSSDLRIPLGPFAAGLADTTIVTSLCPGGKERMRRLMSAVASGRVDLKPLVTHRFKLDEIEAAYDLFGHQRDGVLKVAITP
jgi:alcohol dehydrogenase